MLAIVDKSSKYFVLTMVIFDNLEAAEKTNDSINQLRKSLKFQKDKEFKFNKETSSEEKEVFLRKMSHHDFRYRSVVINKSVLLKKGFQNTTDNLYMLVTDQLFLRAGGRLNNASLFADRTNKTFVTEFNGYLRKKLSTNMMKLIGQIRYKDSKNNNLLQLAGMICGAIYESYEDKNQQFYKLIKKREENLWEPY